MKWIEESVESILKDANPLTRLYINDAYKERRAFFFMILTFLVLALVSKPMTSILFCYVKLDSLFLLFGSSKEFAICLLSFVTISVLYKVVYKSLHIKQLLPTLVSCFRSLCLLILYFKFWKFQFEPFAHFQVGGFYGADIIIIISATLLLDFKPYKQLPEQKVGEGFYSDSFDENVDNDSLIRKHIASEIANTINQTYPKKSFAIGVIGEWGYGKTTFINFIFSELRKSEENIIIRFHPWKPNNKPQIISEFYTQLISKVEKIDYILGRSISLYADKLVGSDSEQIGLIKNVIANLRGNNESIDYYFEIIRESIQNSGKKFIVHIDDLDRLSGEEVLEILKIIRGTAEFPNFFFITGYDLTYIREVMTRSNQVAIEQDYLRKIFQLEFVLPPISYDMLLKQFEKILGNDFFLLKFKEEILSAFRLLEIDPIFYDLKSMEEFVERDNQLIKNPRDVIRILNSLKVSLMLIGDYVLVKDLVIVEVLKNQYPELYYDLSTRPDLFTKGYSDKIREQKAMLNENRINVSVSKFSHLKDRGVESIVKKLFNISSLGFNSFDINEFRFPIGLNENYKIYFQLFSQNRMSPNEKSMFWKSGLSWRFDYLDNLKKGNNIIGVADLFPKKLKPQSIIELEINLNTFIYASDVVDKLSSDAVSLIEEFISQNENEINILIKSIILKIAKNGKIDLMSRSIFLRNFLLLVIEKKVYYSEVFDKTFIATIKSEIFRMFNNFLLESKYLRRDTFYFYSLNVDEIDRDSIKLTKEANKLFRKFIENHKRNYIILLLRPDDYSRDANYTFESSIQQTFEEVPDSPYRKFEQFLQEAVDSVDCQDLAFILDIFNRFKENSFERVELSPNDITKLNELQAPYLN